MAFDDLTQAQRREIVNLIQASETGEYSPEFQVEHVPANQLEHPRINLRVIRLDGNRGPLIEFYDVNDFYSIAATGYVEGTTPEGDEVRLTEKAFVQYRLLTELPNRHTSPSDTIKYWLEDFMHVEEALNAREWDTTERRFDKWKERATRSLADNLISEVSADLLRFTFLPKRSGRITRPFEHIEQIAKTIISCRRFLEEVLVEINKYGEDAYTREAPTHLPLEAHSSASAASEGIQLTGVPPSVSSQEAAGSDAKFLYANELYETAKGLINNVKPLDDKTARMIVETCDDAIKEFGNTNQDKKVELRKWKSRAEEILPPKTIKELTERAEGYVLKKGYPRNKLWRNVLLSLVGISAIIGVFIAIYKVLPERIPRQPPSNSNKPTQASAGAEIIDLALSPDLHMWEDLSDQIDGMIDDLQRLENFDPDKPGLFHFRSNHYKGRDPVILASHGNASHPSLDFLSLAKQFFECETRFDDRGRPIARDPLVLNVSVRNNTDRQMTVTKAALRLVKAELRKTSGDGIIELSPEKHLRPATIIEFKWPISPEELFNALEGTLDTPREGLATFRNPLIIGPKAIERISLKVDVPLMPIIGRHNALIQFVFTTSEGEVVSQQIYLSSEEL